jgi:hypothetical protein
MWEFSKKALGSESDNLVNVAKSGLQKLQKSGMPAVGEVRKGYRFKGGKPNLAENWEKVL